MFVLNVEMTYFFAQLICLDFDELERICAGHFAPWPNHRRDTMCGNTGARYVIAGYAPRYRVICWGIVALFVFLVSRVPALVWVNTARHHYTTISTLFLSTVNLLVMSASNYTPKLLPTNKSKTLFKHILLFNSF